MVNHDSDPTVPYNMVTSTKPSVSNIRVLFCPCVVQKTTAHNSIKTLNMNNQSQNVFWGIFFGNPQNQKG